MRSWRSRNLALVCWTTTIIPATLSFAAQCGGNTSLSYCGAGLPDNFCCGPGNTCLQLFNVLTPAAICCPDGANPAAPAHMLDTRVALQECGPQCCPLGYACQFGLNTNAYSCIMKNSTRSGSPPDPPSASQSGIVTTVWIPAVTSANTALVTTSPSSSPIPTDNPIGKSPSHSNSSANKFPTVAILATLFPAIAVGIILVLLVIFLKRRRERRKKLVRGEELFGGPTPPSSRGGDLQISSPINRPGMAARTDFIHKRSASGSSIPPPATSPMRNVIQASQNLRRTLSSGGTLVPTTSTSGQKTPTMSLGPIFETPTRPQRTSQGKLRGFFSPNEFSRSKLSPRSKYPSIDPTRLILSRSGASQETIDVLMRPAPHDFEAFESPVEPPFENGSVTPETTYSDVYRAAGVSPTKVEARGRQMTRHRVDTMSTLGDVSVTDREINVRFKIGD
ncbi:hypothetical protein FKW77_006748 [Venturia effusa]|uniref:Extracellular membrane protein CFEM domain-containing protein n=1 Tax=Venturia effusa TaxID=50376 RepID=A0A517LB17_9PEZI|nr:hypothetical protein FKW77_006748 [Venturia effusa]